MKKIIAAVSDKQSFLDALDSNVDTIFYLTPNINTLESLIKESHLCGKKTYIHIDMAEGIGKDQYGIEFVSKFGIDGIISTRGNIIKIAKKLNLTTVQRFFAIDSHSINTAIETTNSIHPDMIEILPGVALGAIAKIKDNVSIPIIAGGLISAKKDVDNAIKSGAQAVSTSSQELWTINN